MATSHTTPTPPQPQPRPGDSQFGETRAAGDERRGQEAAEAPMPRWLAGATGNGLEPWKPMYALGIVMIILGVIILAWPSATLFVAAILFGCYLVLSGVIGMIEGLTDRHRTTGSRVAYTVLGALGIVVGLFCIRRVDVTVLILAFLLSMFWIMRGIIDLSAASSRGGMHGNGWLAFSGVLSIIAGILVLFWPGITLTVLVVFAGIWLLVYGFMLLYGGYQLRKLGMEARHEGHGAIPAQGAPHQERPAGAG